MSRATPTARRRMPRAQREEQILTVAERVFAQQGYQATTMEDIADHVGVTKPLIYDYFGSKDGLLVACVDRARAELAEVTEAAWRTLPADAPLETVMRTGIEAFFTFIDSHACAFALIQNEGAVAASTSSEIERIRTQQSAVVITGLRRSPALVAVPDRLLEGFAEILVGACERVAVWRTHRQDVSSTDATALVMAALWPGISSLAR